MNVACVTVRGGFAIDDLASGLLAGQAEINVLHNTGLGSPPLRVGQQISDFVEGLAAHALPFG